MIWEHHICWCHLQHWLWEQHTICGGGANKLRVWTSDDEYCAKRNIWHDSNSITTSKRQDYSPNSWWWTIARPTRRLRRQYLQVSNALLIHTLFEYSNSSNNIHYGYRPQIGAPGLSNILMPNCSFFCNDEILITNILSIMASGAKSPNKDGTSSVIEVLAHSWVECSTGERRVQRVSALQ